MFMCPFVVNELCQKNKSIEGVESSGKVSWTKEMLHVFRDICIIAIDRRMRPSTHFDKAK